MPSHLDDKDGNSNPWIATHVREIGFYVKSVLSVKVYIDSFSKDTRDSF